jgi:hypothetical protein
MNRCNYTTVHGVRGGVEAKAQRKDRNYRLEVSHLRQLEREL